MTQIHEITNQGDCILRFLIAKCLHSQWDEGKRIIIVAADRVGIQIWKRAEQESMCRWWREEDGINYMSQPCPTDRKGGKKTEQSGSGQTTKHSNRRTWRMTKNACCYTILIVFISLRAACSALALLSLSRSIYLSICQWIGLSFIPGLPSLLLALLRSPGFHAEL